MSQLIYNGIALGAIKTNSVERVARMSDDGSEYMWTDFIIDVNCIYSPGTTAYPPLAFPEVTDVQIRAILMQPRQPLIYGEGGIAILEIDSNIPGGAIDCQNGPTPISCTITRIGAARIFFIRYVIKASIYECGVGTFVSAIASSRYSRAESIANTGGYRSTIITTGKAYFRSNVLAALELNADSFRSYIIPRPFISYIRKQINVNLDPNGIQMEFIVIDEEQFVDLGDTSIPGTAGSIGIVNMDLVYTTSSVPRGAIGIAGIATIAKVDASCQGKRDANTWYMMQFLYNCAQNKLGEIWMNGACVDVNTREDVFNNNVSLSLSFLTQGPKAGDPAGDPVPNLAVCVNGFVGEPIMSLPGTGGVNPQLPYSNSTRGITPYQLAVSAFATACFTTPATVGTDLTGTFTPPDLYNNDGLQGIGPQVNIYYNPNVQTQGVNRVPALNNARTSDGGIKYGYINYTIKSKYETINGVVQSPIASVPNQDTSSGSQTSVFYQLFQPQTTKVVNFSIDRYGAVPEVPDPTPVDSSYILLTQEVSPIGIELLQDAITPIYRVTGKYVYGFLSDIDPTQDSIPFDIPAWVQIASSEFTQLEPEDFETGIIFNPSPSSSSSSPSSPGLS